jgi:hypothetical protein
LDLPATLRQIALYVLLMTAIQIQRQLVDLCHQKSVDNVIELERLSPFQSSATRFARDKNVVKPERYYYP